MSSRRTFIVATSAAALLLLSERLAGMQRTGTSRDKLLARVLEALHHPAPAELRVADDTIRSLLARVLGTPVHELDSYADASVAQLKERIQANIAQDYRQRRLRVIEGWWLSETEAGCLELVVRKWGHSPFPRTDLPPVKPLAGK